MLGTFFSAAKHHWVHWTIGSLLSSRSFELYKNILQIDTKDKSPGTHATQSCWRNCLKDKKSFFKNANFLLGLHNVLFFYHHRNINLHNNYIAKDCKTTPFFLFWVSWKNIRKKLHFKAFNLFNKRMLEIIGIKWMCSVIV